MALVVGLPVLIAVVVRVLVELGVPMGPVIATIHQCRADLQAEIKAMAPEAEVRLLGRRRLRDMLTQE